VSEQLSITGDLAIIPRLGPAQLEVLVALRELGRLDDDEAGAIIHERRGKHTRDVRCTYCSQDGKHVLASLRGHGLAKRKRGDGWIDPNKSGPAMDTSLSSGAAPVGQNLRGGGARTLSTDEGRDEAERHGRVSDALDDIGF
jgi:hypothetical protein